MKSPDPEQSIAIYVWKDEEGNKRINYHDTVWMSEFSVKYVSKEEFKRISDAKSDKVQEILDFYIG